MQAIAGMREADKSMSEGGLKEAQLTGRPDVTVEVEGIASNRSLTQYEGR